PPPLPAFQLGRSTPPGTAVGGDGPVHAGGPPEDGGAVAGVREPAVSPAWCSCCLRGDELGRPQPRAPYTRVGCRFVRRSAEGLLRKRRQGRLGSDEPLHDAVLQRVIGEHHQPPARLEEACCLRKGSSKLLEFTVGLDTEGR